jgi:y4mF family transcriptional regulator
MPQMYAYADIMHVRTIRDLGALIRQNRKDRGWTQAQLADAIGVTRAWVIAVEQGKSRAELGLVLRTLAALDLVADVVPAPPAHAMIDLDELLRGFDG